MVMERNSEEAERVFHQQQREKAASGLQSALHNNEVGWSVHVCIWCTP